MTIEEMIQEVSGKTADNVPKAGFSLLVDMWNINKNDVHSVRDLQICKPELQIQKHGAFIQTDFIFMSPIDSDLESMWKALEYYGELLNEVTESSTEVPVATITITSTEWEGYFHITGVAPVLWTLQPKKPGAPVNVLRIIFKDTDFIFYGDENLNLVNGRNAHES